MPNAECDSTVFDPEAQTRRELVEVRIARGERSAPVSRDAQRSASGRAPLRVATNRVAAHRSGFSFTEILFAVMILGIGFIMVAAMFPVAIRQTEETNQETVAAAVGRTSSNFLTQLAAMPLPESPSQLQVQGLMIAVPGLTTSWQTSPPSVLFPTFPVANIAVASQYKLPTSPTYQSSIVVPGQVWTMCDWRDGWTYSFNGTAPAGVPTQHNLALWQAAAKNMVQPADMRFGFVMMYRRDYIVRGTPGLNGTSIAPATFAQVIVICAQDRNAQTYNPAPNQPTDIPAVPLVISPKTGTPMYPSGQPCSLLPTFIGGDLTTTGRQQGVQLVPSTIGTSYVNFATASSPGSSPAMLAEGAYVVICDDNLSNPSGGPYLHGAMNGRIFRLGAAPDSSMPGWPMLPGSDITSSDYATYSSMAATNSFSNGASQLQFNVFVLGRGVSGGAFAGPAQDVTAYTTYVPIAN